MQEAITKKNLIQEESWVFSNSIVEILSEEFTLIVRFLRFQLG
jgi:hypothetical protein